MAPTASQFAAALAGLPLAVRNLPVAEIVLVMEGLASWGVHSRRHPCHEQTTLQTRLLDLVRVGMGGADRGWTIEAVAVVAELAVQFPLRCKPELPPERHFSQVMAQQSACIILEPPVDCCTRCERADGPGYYALRVMPPKITTLVLSSESVVPALHFSKKCQKCGTRYTYDRMIEQVRDHTAAELQQWIDDDTEDDDSDTHDVAAVAGAGLPPRVGRQHCFYPGLREFSLSKSGRFGLSTSYAHDAAISMGRNA
jgi:CxC5 like cysteine cluster associated with KDZ transposases